MKQSELLAEIQTLIDQVITANREEDPAWFIQRIVARHRGIRGKDKPFYVLCAYEHVHDTVRSALRQYHSPPEEDGQRPQLLLPGFKRVQRAYLIERKGTRKLVPTALMTPAELRTKAKEYREIGAGCREHALELDRLADDREADGR
jgi:hypothetical protein